MGEDGDSPAAFPGTWSSQEHSNYRAVEEQLGEKAALTPKFGHSDACVGSGADPAGFSPGCEGLMSDADS